MRPLTSPEILTSGGILNCINKRRKIEGLYSLPGKILRQLLLMTKDFHKTVKKAKELTEYDKTANAFYKAYRKPLPLWRILFCSFESNCKWYEKRVKRFLIAD